MSLFANLKNDGLEETQDRLGGFGPKESDIYSGKIKVAYAGKSDHGAQFVALTVDLNGSEYRETVYITNRKGENFFLNKDDKTKKVPLPGFTTIDDICLCADGKSLSEQPTEEKIVKIYDFEAKKELPQSVPVLIDLTGKPISLALLKVLENKNEKASDGSYVPVADTREINVIDKVFHTETKMTVVEARNSATEPVFWDGWLERNKGKTRDKREIKDGAGGAPGKPQARGATAAPTAAAGAPARKSLFGKSS